MLAPDMSRNKRGGGCIAPSNREFTQYGQLAVKTQGFPCIGTGVLPVSLTVALYRSRWRGGGVAGWRVAVSGWWLPVGAPAPVGTRRTATASNIRSVRTVRTTRLARSAPALR